MLRTSHIYFYTFQDISHYTFQDMLRYLPISSAIICGNSVGRFLCTPYNSNLASRDYYLFLCGEWFCWWKISLKKVVQFFCQEGWELLWECHYEIIFEMAANYRTERSKFHLNRLTLTMINNTFNLTPKQWISFY